MIKKVLDMACSDSSYIISVKMRLGLNNPEDGMSVINVLNEYPLKGVIIHPRTGSQMYTGQVDPDAFGMFAGSCKHEVTYNGDIFSYDNFIEISSRFPFIKNYMLGRGALRNPFLPSLIKRHNVSVEDKINTVRKFHDDIFNYFKDRLSGEKHLCDKMKEFWDYMHVHLDSDGRFMKKIRKCNRASEYLELMHRVFQPDSVWNDR
jgi:tRNA-dihydrouridine synthase